MKRLPIFLVVMMFAACIQTVHAGVKAQNGKYVVSSGALSLVCNDNGYVRSQINGSGSAPLSNFIKIYNGRKSDSPISIGAPKMVRLAGSTLNMDYGRIPGGPVLSARIADKGRYISYTVNVKNYGKAQMWLRLTANLPLAFSDSTVNYWDGAMLSQKASGSLSNNSLPGTFPAAAVYNDAYGQAIGIAAGQIFSYIENSLYYENMRTLSFGVKLVLNPGESRDVEFITYGFTPDYGFLNAIDTYYSIYPEAFEAKSDIDPRICETTDPMSVRDDERSHSKGYYEGYRRAFAGMTWWYAPFKKDGDWWGSEAEWDVVLARQNALEASYTVPLADFHKDLKQQFDRADKNGIAPMFYIAPWCEEDLAKRRYANCTMKKNDGSIFKIEKWTLPWADDVSMWWGGKFGADTKRDLSVIGRELPISGFALDCADGHMKAYASDVELGKIAGRAYDENGVYAEETVAVANVMDYIHTIKGDEYRMGTWGNFFNPFPYYVGFRSDVALIEGHFTRVLQSMNEYQRLRYLLGSKPRKMFGGIDRETLGKSVDWKNTSPERIKTIYRNLWDSVLLACFKLDILPSADMVYGYTDIMKSMPVLLAVSKEGWEPIPAVKLDADIWNARYGNNLDTYIFVGNQQVAEKQINAAVDNKYLGKGAYLFSTFDGSALANSVQNGQTKLAFTLAPKKHIVLKALMNVTGPAQTAGEVSETGDVSAGRITAKLSADGPARVAARIPDSASAVSVMVNGASVKFTQTSSTVSFDASLKGESEVVVDWKSAIYLSSEKALQDFPYVSADGTPACTILLKDNADEWDTAAASRLQEYFRFYFEKVKGQSVLIPIKKESESPSGNLVVIDAGASESLRVDGNRLIIDGPAGRKRMAAMERLMRVLDGKYVYYGTIGGDYHSSWVAGDEDTKAMREKAGLGKGRVLD